MLYFCIGNTIGILMTTYYIYFVLSLHFGI